MKRDAGFGIRCSFKSKYRRIPCYKEFHSRGKMSNLLSEFLFRSQVSICLVKPMFRDLSQQIEITLLLCLEDDKVQSMTLLRDL